MRFEQARECLKIRIESVALRIGDKPTYKLSSGILSNYYFNMKKVTLDSHGAILTGYVVYHLIKKLSISGIGGLTLGADPISYSASFIAALKGRLIDPFIVRKEPKKHGIKKWIEGNVEPGDKVVVVDDVISTGKSIIFAVERAQEAGLQVIKVVAVIDRQEEDGIENIRKYVKNVETIFKRDEFIKI